MRPYEQTNSRTYRVRIFKWGTKLQNAWPLKKTFPTFIWKSPCCRHDISMAEEKSVLSIWGSNRTLRNLQLLPPVECVAGEEAKLEEMRVSHRLCHYPSCCPSGGPQTILNKLQVYTCINTLHQLIFISLHFHLRHLPQRSLLTCSWTFHHLFSVPAGFNGTLC